MGRICCRRRRRPPPIGVPQTPQTMTNLKWDRMIRTPPVPTDLVFRDMAVHVRLLSRSKDPLVECLWMLPIWNLVLWNWKA